MIFSPLFFLFSIDICYACYAAALLMPPYLPRHMPLYADFLHTLSPPLTFTAPRCHAAIRHCHALMLLFRYFFVTLMLRHAIFTLTERRFYSSLDAMRDVYAMPYERADTV